MKRLRMVLLIVLCMLTVILCGILVYGMTGHTIYRGINNRKYINNHLVLEKEIPMDGIESILISNKVCSNDIYIRKNDTDTVLVKEYSEFELDEKEISTVRAKNGRLEITGKRKNHRGYYAPFTFTGGRFYTELWLPDSYHGNISLETSSGEILSELDIELKQDFEACTTSGDISLPELTAKNVYVSSTSGYIKIESVQAGDSGAGGSVNIATTSGDIDLNQIAGDLSLSTTSGYTIIETLSGNGQFSSTSGDVSIRRMDGSAVISTTSGDIKIHEGNGDRSVKSISGDIFVEEFDGHFDASATSGSVFIRARSGTGAIETTSGDIQLELKELTNTLKINSSSGEVDVKLSQDNCFEFEASTASGDIDTFFDDVLKYSKKGNQAKGTYGSNNQKGLVGIQTTSGDIRIVQLH